MHTRRTWQAISMSLAVILSSAALAAAPQAIHYQGYLVDADGNPLDETVEMEFRLYDTDVAGEAFWVTPETIAVDVEHGVFRVNLAPVTAEQFAGGDVWLGITVIPADPGEPAQEMEPRLKVLSVPYALVAEHAATADVAGEAAAVTNIDFSTFATGDDVQGVLGICIQEADLTDALQGYCAGPCYGDAEVELFVTENGYVTFDALAQWVADNVETGLDEAKLAAYLAANGYMTEADLLWFLGEAGFLKTEDLAGLGYVPGPHYTDGDVEALLATKDYCQGPCFSGSYNDLADKPSLDGHDADTVDGFDTNATGQPLAQTIPVTDESGKIPQGLLPFSKGDLLAPADRQLVEGLDEYETGYFSVEELGIEGNVAANVKEGVKFGPGKGMTGMHVGGTGIAWWKEPTAYLAYDDFSLPSLDGERWSTSSGSSCVGGHGPFVAEVVATDLAMGTAGEAHLYGQAQLVSTVNVRNRHLFLRYNIQHTCTWANDSPVFKYSSSVVVADYLISIPLIASSLSVWGYVEVVAMGEDQYDVVHNGALVHSVKLPEGISITVSSGCHCGGAGGCNWCACSHAYLDDIRVSATSADGIALNCDDGNPCTHDYYGGESADDCFHANNTELCNDNNACTANDVCGEGLCAGTPIDCNDGDEYTKDSCDVLWGCQHERCALSEYEFGEGAEGWKLNADWSWSEGSPGAAGGYLQGKVGINAVESPVFPAKSGMLLVRYKCLGTGGLAFLSGPNIDCQFSGDWEEKYVQLDSADWLVKFTHYGTGDVLVDRVEVLEPCQ